MVAEKLNALVQRLADQSSHLETDAARIAFVTEVEGGISGNDFSVAPLVEVGLHCLAAEVLVTIAKPEGEQLLLRVLQHLDVASALASDSDGATFTSQIRRLRADAFMWAPSLPPQLVAVAIAAWEQALSDPGATEDEAYRGALAYNSALFRLKESGALEDPEVRSHVQSLFELARESYRRSGRMAEAADAAFYLAQIGLRELQSDRIAPEQRTQTFESAWHRIGESMAAHDPISDLDGWGRANDMAGALLLRRPGADPSDNSREAIKYFDRALHAYQKLDDQAAIRLCAMNLLDAMDARPIPWDEAMAKRYEVYVDAVREAVGDTNADIAQARLKFRLANACMKVAVGASHKTRAEIFERASSLATEAVSAATAVGDHRVSATGLKLLGATLLGDNPASGEGEPGPYDCDRLVWASEVLNLAVEHGRAANDAAVLAPPLRLLSVALARRIQQCGEFDLLDRCMSALEQTIPLSQGAELVATGANYVGLTLLAHQGGHPWPIDRAREVLRKAIDALTDVDRPTLAEYVKSLERRLDELEFVGRGGMARVEAPRLPSGDLDPRHVLETALRQRTVLLIVHGLLSSNPRHVLEGLQAYGRSDESGEVAAAEVKSILQALVNEGRMPEAGGLNVAEVTKTVNTLIARSRAAGPGVVVDELARAFTELQSGRTVTEEALGIASDRSARRAFLAQFVAQTPDYSPDRAHTLYENLALGVELDLEAMEKNGIPASDPDRYLAAQAALRQARAFASDWIDQDRTSNSSRPGKELITRALEDGEPFVLILRAFALDIAIREASDGTLSLLSGVGDARIGHRVIEMTSGSTHVVDALCDALPEGAHAIIVANVLDLAPPSRPAKIFVSDIEWQRLAFSLIPEASAIILIFPTTGAKAATGVAQEVVAIQRLECAARTAVVLASPRDPADVFDVLAGPKPAHEIDEETTAGDIARLGFSCVFTDSEIDERRGPFADKVRSLMRGGWR